MKKWIFLTVIAGVMPFTLRAQDDMYFTPTKPAEKSTVAPVQTEQPTYYSGINQTVDEYNRRNLYSSYQVVGTDSLGNDIIEMTEGTGYPKDTVYVFRDNDDDFAYSRRMGRFDGFYGWYDPFFYNYWGGPWSYWSWYDPWYYGYYGYYGIYDPWLYGYGYGWGYYGWRYSSWGWPYYGRYYGWYTPWYYNSYGPGIAYRGTNGTRNHGSVARGGSSTGTRGVFGGSRNSGTFGNNNINNNGSSTASAARQGVSNGTRRSTGGFVGGSRSNVGTTNTGQRSSGAYNGGNRSNGGTFGGSNTNTPRQTSTPSRNSSPSPSYSGSSHSSGGGSFGGGSRGGGGSFGGGGGSRGGGGSFGGGSRGHR